jgi:hypothetical protein
VRSRLALGRSLYLVVVVGALLTLSAWAYASAPPVAPIAGAGANTLVDDDGEGALFELTGLKPGHPEFRCITVSSDGPDPVGIRLRGSLDGSGLGEYLRLTVDTGSGGHFGNCGGFNGAAALYDGSLADFVDQHHDYDSGLVAVAPSAHGTKTFRLRVALDDVAAAQGRTATATFAWDASTDDAVVVPPPPPPPPPPAPVPEPAPVDSPAPPAPESPAVEDEKRAVEDSPDTGSRDPEAEVRSEPGAPDTTTTPAQASPSPTPVNPGAGPSAPPGPLTGVQSERDESTPSRRSKKKRATPAATARKTLAAGRRPAPAPAIAAEAKAKADSGRVGAIAGAIADVITKVVAPVVQRTAFPLILLILGGLFLLIQNRIDRRDPKLARAPLHAQPDLPFLPPPSPGDDRP